MSQIVIFKWQRESKVGRHRAGCRPMCLCECNIGPGCMLAYRRADAVGTWVAVFALSYAAFLRAHSQFPRRDRNRP